MRLAPGSAAMPERPGDRFFPRAWPALGDSVLPSLSNFGQVTIMLVDVDSGAKVGSAALAALIALLADASAEIGQASNPVTPSIVPASELDSGWLNMS